MESCRTHPGGSHINPSHTPTSISPVSPHLLVGRVLGLYRYILGYIPLGSSASGLEKSDGAIGLTAKPLSVGDRILCEGIIEERKEGWTGKRECGEMLSMEDRGEGMTLTAFPLLPLPPHLAQCVSYASP